MLPPFNLNHFVLSSSSMGPLCRSILCSFPRHWYRIHLLPCVLFSYWTIFPVLFYTGPTCIGLHAPQNGYPPKPLFITFSTPCFTRATLICPLTVLLAIVACIVDLHTPSASTIVFQLCIQIRCCTVRVAPERTEQLNSFSFMYAPYFYLLLSAHVIDTWSSANCSCCIC
jgi:hypothetical protein